MRSVRKLIVVVGFAVVCNPAWSSTFKTYTIPGTSLTVDLDTRFNDENVDNIRKTLSVFPAKIIQNTIKYVEFFPSPLRNFISADIPTGGIQIYSGNADETVRQIRRLSVGVGLLTYYNALDPSDRAAWDAIPGRTARPSDDFAATYFNEYYLNSYGFMDSAVAHLLETGDSTPLASLFFIGSQFADPVTRKISTYCQSVTAIDGCHRIESKQDDFTWNEDNIMFGNYKFFLKDNQVIAVQIGNDPKVAVKNPFTVAPTALQVFTPRELVATSVPGWKVEIQSPIDLSYGLLPSERDQIQALLGVISSRQLNSLQLIQIKSLRTMPQTDPPLPVCSYSGRATITCYVGKMSERKDTPLDMTALFGQVIGEDYYDFGMDRKAAQEWDNLWDHVPGYSRFDFAFYYQQWLTNSQDALSSAYEAALNGNNLLFKVALYMTGHFFDSPSSKVRTGALDSRKVVTMDRQILSWTDNTIRLLNYVFQLQQDPNTGKSQIISFQRNNEDPIPMDPMDIPTTFQNVVPHVVTVAPESPECPVVTNDSFKSNIIRSKTIEGRSLPKLQFMISDHAPHVYSPVLMKTKTGFKVRPMDVETNPHPATVIQVK